MKVLIRQFFGGKNHSWFFVGLGIAESLINLGHQVDIYSTDGIKYLPNHLKNNLIGYNDEDTPAKIIGKLPEGIYDAQISYTSMKNFPYYLSNGFKNRFGIWCYEWDGKNVLPSGFAKHYQSCDYLCAPSNYAKQIFVNSSIPADKVHVIPHGINVESYKKTSTVKIKTDKKYKILANIAQLHLRKNIPGLLEAYGRAFTNKDDVVLVLKSKEKPKVFPFDVSLNECLSNFKKKFPKHAEIKIFSEFVEDMSDLYRSVDSVYTMSHCEGYYMPGLEAIATGKLSIAPNHGGQLDFLNNDNAYLVSGEVVRADPKSMYWESNPNGLWFKPSIEDGAEKLQLSYKNYPVINAKLEQQRSEVYAKYNWETVTKQMLALCK